MMKTLERRALEKLWKVYAVFADDRILYSTIFIRLYWIPDWNIPTLKIDMNKLFFNPKYVVESIDKQLEFLCLHELNHIVTAYNRADELWKTLKRTRTVLGFLKKLSKYARDPFLWDKVVNAYWGGI